MNKIYTFLIAVLMMSNANAQILMGDMDGDGSLSISDITSVIDCYLDGSAKYLKINPYVVDNSAIVGTWYASGTSSITFNEDGTIPIADAVYTYEFMPFQGKVLVYSPDGTLSMVYEVFKVTHDALTMSTRGASIETYTSTKPVQLVTDITLSSTSLNLAPNTNEMLTAIVSPSYAGNASVSWSSSNESVAKVMDGLVLAVSDGIATITCTANDGSGVTATCSVKVETPTVHEYVDLGLSVKWATMNVGATTPEGYGDYFAWGETKSKSTYDWSTYKWCKDSYDTLTKYCVRNIYGIVDNKTILDLSDDAAHENWGGDWRMPTYAELNELMTKCSWTWTTQKGVNGYKVTSNTNNNYIFLPAAGYRYDSSLNDVGSGGDYWSSSLNTSNSSYTFYLNFNSNYVYWYSFSRSYGQSVRAVCQ